MTTPNTITVPRNIDNNNIANYVDDATMVNFTVTGTLTLTGATIVDFPSAGLPNPLAITNITDINPGAGITIDATQNGPINIQTTGAVPTDINVISNNNINMTSTNNIVLSGNALDVSGMSSSIGLSGIFPDPLIVTNLNVTNNANITNIDATTMRLINIINEYSTDQSMVAVSDLKVPTERAVVMYLNNYYITSGTFNTSWVGPVAAEATTIEYQIIADEQVLLQLNGFSKVGNNVATTITTSGALPATARPIVNKTFPICIQNTGVYSTGKITITTAGAITIRTGSGGNFTATAILLHGFDSIDFKYKK